ncbi:MAG: DUF4197 domain-containing protein [Proteobacteria bacterium]|nr:DUF4197 domain-containing protein [Pseudomonadota bacterium]
MLFTKRSFILVQPCIVRRGIALKEKKIREDPAARITDLLRKVFGGH